MSLKLPPTSLPIVGNSHVPLSLFCDLASAATSFIVLRGCHWPCSSLWKPRSYIISKRVCRVPTSFGHQCPACGLGGCGSQMEL